MIGSQGQKVATIFGDNLRPGSAPHFPSANPPRPSRNSSKLNPEEATAETNSPEALADLQAEPPMPPGLRTGNALSPTANSAAAFAVRCEILASARDFVRIWHPLAELRSSLECEWDVLSDPLYFLACTDRARRSCSVACWHGDELIGVLLATRQYICGIPTGYAISGDFSGRGSLLCRPERQSIVLNNAVRFLLGHGVHSLHVRVSPAVSFAASLEPLAAKQFEARIPGDSTLLPATYDGFLATLGKHTRRNVRYYSRRAAAAGMSFAPDISAAEYADAVARLNRSSRFPIGARQFARDERLLELHQVGRFALRDSCGEIVAALCGFSRRGRFHLLTQLNDSRLASFSLSLVLRGQTVEHLIATGHTELQFMGGTSLSLGRFCDPLPYRSIFVDLPGPVQNTAKWLASRLIDWLARHSRPIPEQLEHFCGSFLADERLIGRTALRPAAVVDREMLTRISSGRVFQPPTAALINLPDKL